MPAAVAPRESRSRWSHVRQIRFSRQLTMVVSASIVLLAVASSVVTSWEASDRVRAYLINQGRQITENLAQQSVLALLYHSAENAKPALTSTLAFPDVVQASIADTERHVLVSRSKDGTPSSLSPHWSSLPVTDVLTDEDKDNFYFNVSVFSAPGESSPFESSDAGTPILGEVQVVVGKKGLNDLVRSLFIGNLILSLGFAAALLWLIHRFTRSLLRPLDDLSQLMLRARAGESGIRSSPNGPQDIAAMGHAFNRMMDVLEEREATLEQTVLRRTQKLELANHELGQTLETVKTMQSELVRSEKLAALGALVAGVAHELNTPIGNCVTVASAMKHQTSTLIRDMQAGTLRKSSLEAAAAATAEGVDIMERNLRRASELIGSFKRVAVDRTSDKRRSFDLRLSLQEILVTLEPMYRKTPYKLSTDLVDDIEMESYPGPLGQVITNFISNAIAHGFEGRESGSMHLACRRVGAKSVEITFADDGVGIAEQHIPKVFDPFFTTKLGQGGSGLGMNIVYNLVTNILGGKITLKSEVGKGTTFTLLLPLHAPEHVEMVH